VEWVIEEGTSVQAKAELMRLNDETARLRVQEAEAVVEGADAEVEAAKQEAAAFPARVQSAVKSAEAAAARVKAAEELLREREAQQSLMTITRAELAALRAEVAQLQQLAAAEKTRAGELAASDPNLRVRAAQARKTAAEVARTQARNALRDCTLTAPTDGVVLRVQVSVGESVTPGGFQPVIVFRPVSPLVVRAELDQEFLGRVEPGMRATIRDDARADTPTWTGKVERVGAWVARKRSIVLEPGEVNDIRTVECVITLDGPTDGLLIGQRVRVRIGRER
jgi:multidrug resistance efflux pump